MLSRGWSRVSIDLLKFLSCCKDTSVKILTDGRMGWKCSVYFKLGILNFTSIQVLGIFKHVENDILIDIEFEYLNSVYIFQISGNPVSLFNDVHFQCDPMYPPPLPRFSIWPKLPTSLWTKWIIAQKCDPLCPGQTRPGTTTLVWCGSI